MTNGTRFRTEIEKLLELQTESVAGGYSTQTAHPVVMGLMFLMSALMRY